MNVHHAPLAHAHALDARLLIGALIVLGACAPVDAAELEDPEAQPQAAALSTIDCSERSDFGYRSGTPFDIRVVTVDGRPVELETANAYYVMALAAERDGVELAIVSGFRTMGEQEYFYDCFVTCSCNDCNRAARPGYSNHQSGHALDLNTRAPGVLDWLNAHGADYGFARTVPSEVWHWEWWGGGPGGGPCGGCIPSCDGSVIVGRDCGRGDCAAFGSRCVNDGLGVRCAFAFCPDRGTDTFCVDDRVIGTCSDGAVSTGDCSAFGSRCVDDARGARCAFFACPDTGETTVCLDESRIGTCRDGAISSGDCAAFGSRCVADGAGARCAFYACPDSGETTVCLDERTIGTCRDGAISTGDCGAFGAYCSTAGSGVARCVSSFCAASAAAVPVERDTCLPDGRIVRCTSDGALLEPRDCPSGTACFLAEPNARCGSALDGPPEPDGTDPNAPSADMGSPDGGAGRGAGPSSDAGCGCRAGGSERTGGPLAPALLGAVGLCVLRLRRRRAARRSATAPRQDASASPARGSPPHCDPSSPLAN